MPKLLLCTLALLAPLAASAQQQVCSNKQTDRQISQRIDRLVARMTVAERIAQLQDRAPAIPRLELPAYNWWNEGLHGVARNGYATVFPQAIGLAATFDPALLHQVGDTISTEARAKFNPHAHADSARYAGLTFWSPNINIFRDPRWGRGQETYGEDPFLTATLAGEFVKGLQGSDPFYFKAQATAKHFVAHSVPEKGRDGFNSVVSAHDLADTYLPAFHSVVTKAGAAAIMCSYNAINGVPSCANTSLLQDTVSDRWRFRGYIVSDCDAVGNLTEYQHYTKDNAHGAADALNAGVDLDCGNTYAALQSALDQHLVTEATINESLHRLLQARIQLGMLDPEGCSPYDLITSADNDTPAHRALALRAAEESMVLLKNDGTLPLKSSSRVAVIGPTADDLKVLEANYHGTASAPVTLLEGLTHSFSSVAYAQGSLLAAGVSAPIPRTALHTGPSPDSPQGLTAEYFPAASFDGAPAMTSTVARLEFDLDRVTPTPLLTSPRFAARWSGFVTPPAPGDYVLHVNVERCWDCTTHDQFRLFFDSKEILTDSGPNQLTVHLADTKPHAIRLELIHSGEDEGISLEWEPPAQALLNQALEAAKSADSLIIFAGLSPNLEGEALNLTLPGFSGGDRTSLSLPAAQIALIEGLKPLHKPTTIVLTSGSAVALGSVSQSANSLLEGWYPGEEGGDALGNILTGKTNPSGRLPVTFYRSAADLPEFTNYAVSNRTYRYFNGPVEFPFGFGLSFATFTFSHPVLSRKIVPSDQELHASVKVTNTSSVAGSEVAELYLVTPQTKGSAKPVLAGIARTFLRSGESKTLHFTLGSDELSSVNAAGIRSVQPGTYRILIAGSQPDPTSKGTTFAIVHAHGRRPPLTDAADPPLKLLTARFSR